METKHRTLSLALSAAVLLMSMPLMSSAYDSVQECKDNCNYDYENANKLSCKAKCINITKPSQPEPRETN